MLLVSLMWCSRQKRAAPSGTLKRKHLPGLPPCRKVAGGIRSSSDGDSPVCITRKVGILGCASSIFECDDGDQAAVTLLRL